MVRTVFPRVLLAVGLACCLDARAIDIVVDVLDDPVPDGCTAGACSLREAVALANSLAGVDRIVLPATPGLPLQLTRSGSDDTNARGDIDILDPVEIVGHGADATVLAQTAADRVFDIHLAATGRVTLQGLRIEGGRADTGAGVRTESILVAQDVAWRNNIAPGAGSALHLLARNDAAIAEPRLVLRGAVFADNGYSSGGGDGAIHLTTQMQDGALAVIEDSVFDGNRSMDNGGAILVHASAVDRGGSVRIARSTFAGNLAVVEDTNGGAIAVRASRVALQVIDSVFDGNAARLDGGAIFVSGDATLAITGSTFVANTAELGGAIHAGTLDVVDSEFCDNAAEHSGGAVLARKGTAIAGSTFCNNSAAGVGGGGAIVFRGDSATLSVERSTFGNNSADTGGAITVETGNLQLRSSTLVAPSRLSLDEATLLMYRDPAAGRSIQLRNNILIGSCGYAANPVLVAVHNIEARGDTCRLDDGFAHAGNVIGVTAGDVNLVPLALQGGPTRTRVPQPPSIAIDAGSETGCSALDQRGFVLADGRCDIGAVEAGASPPSPDVFADDFE